MERKQIIQELKQYFSIKELVCPHVYSKFGETAWMFLSTPLLHTLLVIRRDILQKPMTINNSSNYTQRGLRCNMCQIVKSKNSAYLSAHVLGEGCDFTSPNVSAEDIRKLIAENEDKLPYKIRLEKDVNWVHVDCYDNSDNKISYFKA